MQQLHIVVMLMIFHYLLLNKMEIDLHQILIDLGFEDQHNIGIDEESHYRKGDILIINGIDRNGEFWIEDRSGKCIQTEEDIKTLL